MNLKELLLPRDKVFFQLLEEESRNVLMGAQALNDMILNFDSLSEKRKLIYIGLFSGFMLGFVVNLI